MPWLSNYPIGKAGHNLRNTIGPLQRIQPRLPKEVERDSGRGNRTGVGVVIGLWAGVDVQALGEWESFECRRRRVPWIITCAEPGTEIERPEFMEAGVQHSEARVIASRNDDDDIFRH